MKARNRPRNRGNFTPRDTERLDLLDGLIIELVRPARKAARAASPGHPAIEKEFELKTLYQR